MCCSTVQCWASLPGVQCSAVQCSAVQCSAVLCSLGCWIAPRGAARSSRALRSLGCSSGQRTAPRGAVPPPSGCSVARCRAGQRAPGCRASLLGCSSGQCSASGVQLRTVQCSLGCSSGQSIAPGVQHTVGHRVAPRGAAWGCFAGATLHPRCVFGSRGAATPWCHGSPRGAAPHIAAAAGSSGRRVPRGQIFSLQVVITGGVGGGADEVSAVPTTVVLLQPSVGADGTGGAVAARPPALRSAGRRRPGSVLGSPQRGGLREPPWRESGVPSDEGGAAEGRWGGGGRG